MRMPSSRWYEALVGQTVTQIARWQLLHKEGRKNLPTVGYFPFSMIFTQEFHTPTGTSFSTLQATTQLWHPTQRRRSITIPYLTFPILLPSQSD